MFELFSFVFILAAEPAQAFEPKTPTSIRFPGVIPLQLALRHNHTLDKPWLGHPGVEGCTASEGSQRC